MTSQPINNGPLAFQLNSSGLSTMGNCQVLQPVNNGYNPLNDVRTQHVRRTHHSPHRDQSKTPQPTTSCVRPRQQVSPISSPHVTPKPESQSSSPIPESQPSTPGYGNPDIEMESLPQSQRVEIEDITGQEDEYDDIYVPESPRWSPGARSAGTPVPEHNQHSSSPHQSQRAASSNHEARNPSPTTRIYHPDLNGMLFLFIWLFKQMSPGFARYPL